MNQQHWTGTIDSGVRQSCPNNEAHLSIQSWTTVGKARWQITYRHREANDLCSLLGGRGIRHRRDHMDEFCLLEKIARNISLSLGLDVDWYHLPERKAVRTTLKPRPLTFPPSVLSSRCTLSLFLLFLSTNLKWAVTMPVEETRLNFWISVTCPHSTEFYQRRRKMFGDEHSPRYFVLLYKFSVTFDVSRVIKTKWI